MDYDFEFATLQQLDVLFFTSFANRTASPIVNYHSVNDEITNEELAKLSDEILAVYKQKWDKLKAVAKLDYDPIHNFSDNIVEDIGGSDYSTTHDTGTVADTGSIQNTGTVRNSGTLTNTGTQGMVAEKDNTGTQTTAETENRTIADTTYGFNSATHTGKDDESVNRTDNTTRTDNLHEDLSSTRTDNLTETSDNTRTDALTQTNNLTRTNNLTNTYDNDYTKHRELERFGNIGNITTQKMLTEEIELWKWNFINQVLSDVKEFCTIAIYSD